MISWAELVDLNLMRSGDCCWGDDMYWEFLLVCNVLVWFKYDLNYKNSDVIRHYTCLINIFITSFHQSFLM